MNRLKPLLWESDFERVEQAGSVWVCRECKPPLGGRKSGTFFNVVEEYLDDRSRVLVACLGY